MIHIACMMVQEWVVLRAKGWFRGRRTMKKAGNRVLLLWFSCLLVFAANSGAYPVKWTLDNFVFEDGGVAEGSFVVDAYTDFSDVQISSSNASTFRGANYATTFAAYDPYVRDFTVLDGVSESASVLSIGWFPGALGRRAAVINVGFSEASCTHFVQSHADEYCGSYSPSRAGMPGTHLVGVAVDKVNVPEPDVVILMGLGLAGIAFARMNRRQQQRKTATSS